MTPLDLLAATSLLWFPLLQGLVAAVGMYRMFDALGLIENTYKEE